MLHLLRTAFGLLDSAVRSRMGTHVRKFLCFRHWE